VQLTQRTSPVSIGERSVQEDDRYKKEHHVQSAFSRTSTIDASVILCAYTEQRWDDLLAAVDSIQRQTVTPREIILVIDHNPVLFERARRSLTGVRVIENQQSRGLSGARNTGIREARGDVLVFMDEDAAAEPEWLEHLHAHFEVESVSGVGGAIEPWWVNGKPGWFPEEFNWVVGCTYKGMPTTTAPVRNLIGANMSYRQSVFSAAGGFTSGIGRIGTRPLGCEETELCIRTAQLLPQTQFYYEPRAIVHHRVPATRATWRYFFARCYAEGLSKALVSSLVGSGQGLSNERSYTLRTLPKGVLEGIKDAFTKGSIDGLGRAAAIISGLAVTSAGYVVGTMDLWRKSRNTSDGGSK
jgi:glucosyl-dolichyl phosphate glucuronosyltransferase